MRRGYEHLQLLPRVAASLCLEQRPRKALVESFEDLGIFRSKKPCEDLLELIVSEVEDDRSFRLRSVSKH